MGHSGNSGLCKGEGLNLEDRISELPADIKKHILSLLSVRDAILTSTLSRSWRYDWLSLTCLDFGRDFFLKGWKIKNTQRYRQACSRVPSTEEVLRFLEFIDQVVKKLKSSIQKLHIYIPPVPQLSARIASTLAGINAKELDIEVIGDYGFVTLNVICYVPQCVLTSNSITKLSIQGCNLSDTTVSDILLPSLQELSFRDVETNDQVIKNLIASSTATKSLFFYCKGFQSLKVSGLPNLVHLHHESNRGLNIVEIDASNLKSLIHLPSTSGCQLVFITTCPDLAHLKLRYRTSCLGLISSWGTSIQTLSISEHLITESLTIHTYQGLTYLRLTKCDMTSDWLHQYICRLESLKNLEVDSCSAPKSMKISSVYIQSLKVSSDANCYGRKLEQVEINCPNLHDFNYCTNGPIFSLSFIASSSPTCVSLRFDLNSTKVTTWDVNLIELFNKLRQAKYFFIETRFIENVLIPRRLRQRYASPLCQFEQLKIFCEASVSSLDVKRCIEAILWLCPQLKTLQLLHKRLYLPVAPDSCASEKHLLKFVLKLDYKEPINLDQVSCGCYSTLPVSCWRHSLRDFQIVEQQGFEDDDGSVRKFLESAISGN